MKNKHRVSFSQCAATRRHLLKREPTAFDIQLKSFQEQRKQMLSSWQRRAEIEFAPLLVPKAETACMCLSSPPPEPDTESVSTKRWRKHGEAKNPPALMWASAKVSSICYIFCFPGGGMRARSENYMAHRHFSVHSNKASQRVAWGVFHKPDEWSAAGLVGVQLWSVALFFVS